MGRMWLKDDGTSVKRHKCCCLFTWILTIKAAWILHELLNIIHIRAGLGCSDVCLHPDAGPQDERPQLLSFAAVWVWGTFLKICSKTHQACFSAWRRPHLRHSSFTANASWSTWRKRAPSQQTLFWADASVLHLLPESHHSSKWCRLLLSLLVFTFV